MVIVLMGVAGVGKTAIGRQLAARIGAEFLDADDHHPPANVAKMTAGVALDEGDRRPWLLELNRRLRSAEENEDTVVLACSALTEEHRRLLLAGVRTAEVVHLTASPQIIRQRLEARQGHFFPAGLLESQLAILQAPAKALRVDSGAELLGVVEEITRHVDSLRAAPSGDGGRVDDEPR